MKVPKGVEIAGKIFDKVKYDSTFEAEIIYPQMEKKKRSVLIITNISIEDNMRWLMIFISARPLG